MPETPKLTKPEIIAEYKSRSAGNSTDASEIVQSICDDFGLDYGYVRQIMVEEWNMGFSG